MRVRLGFVAMSMVLKNASPSKTMTLKHFQALPDKEAALRKLTRISSENLHNSLRVLKHANESGIHLYRFSSKLIPLFGHPETEGWDFFQYLAKDFAELGSFVRSHQMRVSFHPDHFTVLNSPHEEVLINSIHVLKRHVQIFEAMQLSDQAKLVIHVGGGYHNKSASLERFRQNWPNVPQGVRELVTLENDDKTYTAKETLELCESICVPMVLDLHHHQCNHEENSRISDLIEPIFATWRNPNHVPKIHFSSSKNEKEFRAHADYVNPGDLLPFLNLVRQLDKDIDIMIEAKQKDLALFKLMKDLASMADVKPIDGGSFWFRP